MPSTLTTITDFSEPFLLEVYASARADEMAQIPWSDEQKTAFLHSQLQAQHEYYRSRYPNGSFNIIKSGNASIGRLYLAELDDEIRIIDITILPEYRHQNTGAEMIVKILQKCETLGKPAQIYIESYNPSAKLFARLGFEPTAVEGIYLLWRWTPPPPPAAAGKS